MTQVFLQALNEQIEFHAVDALRLPFGDQSLDIIYGFAFVHYLQDLDQFICEVNRCLKTNGRCVFFDDAMSPIWHTLTCSIFRPLQLLSHWLHGISPEDKIATEKGGFTLQEISELMQRQGFSGMTFIRCEFLEYLVVRCAEKLLSPLKVLLPAARAGNRLLGDRFMSKQGIRLVWGLQK
ncbi:MAG: class I SAM-dependent methyltransferase [Pirellulaceae bacterium]